MWYFELWCENDLIYKSREFGTKERAIKEAESVIEYEISHGSNKKRDDYSYEMYCTCEDEEVY